MIQLYHVYRKRGPGMSDRKILLHSCCGPCSSACLERLLPDHDVTVFYYNPCIDDPEEYEKRKENQLKLISAMSSMGNVDFAAGLYDPERYLELVKGLEEEPEGGARCSVCFRMRLLEAARYAKAHGYDAFTTTLTVSPHKNFKVISKIGEEVAEEVGIEYLPYDFKKKDGFLRSIQLSKKFGLYRQDYCGCRFSKR
jgi:predicted adenine nucleotide alpha hydrolase (AANH) superfamily ATPase